MRTTVTLDPDIESLIRTAMKLRRLSFKEAPNSASRLGLTNNRADRRDFVQQTFALGTEQKFRWDKALAVAEALEDEELTRTVLTKMTVIDLNILISAVNSDAALLWLPSIRRRCI